MTLETARCTRCGSNNFILMCVKCNDIGKRDDEIRRECAEKAYNAWFKNTSDWRGIESAIIGKEADNG